MYDCLVWKNRYRKSHQELECLFQKMVPKIQNLKEKSKDKRRFQSQLSSCYVVLNKRTNVLWNIRTRLRFNRDSWVRKSTNPSMNLNNLRTELVIRGALTMKRRYLFFACIREILSWNRIQSWRISLLKMFLRRTFKIFTMWKTCNEETNIFTKDSEIAHKVYFIEISDFWKW